MQKINAQKSKNNQKPGGKDKQKQKGKQPKKPIEEEYDEEQLDELDDLDDDDIDMFADDIDKDADLFWKLEVTHNEPSTMDVPENFDGIVCITQASFGESVNKSSRTIVCCTTPSSNEPVPICVLNQGTHETHPLNLKFSSPSEFSLKGQQPSTVYLTGYVEPALDNLHDMDDDADYDIPEHLLSKMKRRFGEEDEEEDEAGQFEPAAKKRKIEPPKGKKAIENKKETTQAEEKKPVQAPGKKNQNQKKEANKKPQTEAAKPQTEAAKPQKEATKSHTEAPKTPKITIEASKTEASKTEAPQSQPQTPLDKQNTTASTEAVSNNNETPQSTKTDSAKLTKSQKKNLKKKEKQEKQTNGKTEENKSKEEGKPETTTPIAKPNETPTKNGTAEDEDKTGDKQKKETEKKLPSGIEIKDIKVGTGAEIKQGQTIHIMYAGQLANKTVFDKHLTGSGFSYKFGSDEGIKGWHLGMKGMKIGGKRRIVVPPKFAFGVDGNPSKNVPGDATVTYTIEVLEEPKQ